MSYLDIARSVISVISGDERNERRPSPAPGPAGGERASPYERNELNEKSPGPDARATAPGLDPSLHWIVVYRGPVASSIPPDDWSGVVPAGCGVPHACKELGPCPHYAQHGYCWKECP
jgi:hypothetical protein